MDRISVKLFLVIEVCFLERPRILIYGSCLTVNCFDLTLSNLEGSCKTKNDIFLTVTV